MQIITADESRIDAILAIDGECISPPWTHGQMLSEIYNENTCFNLATENDELLGFCILRKIGDEAELLRIAVSPAARQKGIGGKLLEAAVKNAKSDGVEKIFLEVRISNSAALSLYEELGFTHAGVRRAYYDKPLEDARVMVLEDLNV